MRALVFAFLALAMPLTALSTDEAELIGTKLFQNECIGKTALLTNWHRLEQFPSFGIMHCIWYPKSYHGKFEETFPSLVAYLKKNKVRLPAWVVKARHAPWSSREQFQAELNGPQLTELRSVLAETFSLQTQFVIKRFDATIRAIVAAAQNKKAIRAKIELLKKSPNGLYALIDYSNCKGSGVSPAERYHGKGWGLLQVLEAMPDNPKSPVKSFVTAAQAVLNERVKNSLPARRENELLKGWFNRLATYTR